MRSTITIVISCSILALTGCVTDLGDYVPYPEKPFVRMEQIRVSWTPYSHTIYSFRLAQGGKVQTIEFQKGSGYIPRTLASDAKPFFRYEETIGVDEIVFRLEKAANEYVSVYGQDYTLGQSNHFAQKLLDSLPELKTKGWRLSSTAWGKNDSYD